MIYFGLLSMWLFSSHDSNHVFDRLTRAYSNYFFLLFLIDFSILITSFNIRFIED